MSDEIITYSIFYPNSNCHYNHIFDVRRVQASLPSMLLQNFHEGFKLCSVKHKCQCHGKVFLPPCVEITIFWISPGPTASPRRVGTPAPSSTRTSSDLTLAYPGLSWAGGPKSEHPSPCRVSPCPGQDFTFAPVDFGVLFVGPLPQLGLFCWQPCTQGHPLVSLASCHLFTQWESTPSPPPGNWEWFHLCSLNITIQINIYSLGKLVPDGRQTFRADFIFHPILLDS